MRKITFLLTLCFCLLTGVQCGWAQAFYLPKVSTGTTVYEYYLQGAGNNNTYYCTTNVGTDNSVTFNNAGERLKVKFVSTGTDGEYNVIPTNVSGKSIIGVTGTGNGSVVTYYENSADAQNAVFLLKAETGINGYKPAFDLYPKGGTSGWNFHGGVSAGTYKSVKLWTNGDQGSKWNLIPANWEALNAMRQDIFDNISSLSVFNVIGGLKSENHSDAYALEQSVLNEAKNTLNGMTSYSYENACALLAFQINSTDLNNAIAAINTNDLYLPTGYYYFKSLNTDNRPPYLFNDYFRETNPQHITLQSNSKGTTNGYFWHVTNNGNGTIAIVNGEGSPVIQGDQGNANTNAVTASITTNSTLTFNTFNATYFKNFGGMHFTENLNASNGGYKLSDNTFFLTTWDAGAQYADNRWTFEPIDVTGKTIYTVNISGLGDEVTEAPYITCGEDKALNGGFLIKDAAIDANAVTASAIRGYSVKSTTIESNTIKVVYEVDRSYVTINYTIHSNALNENYTGSYSAVWNGESTELPQIAGVTGYTLENASFTQSDENYSMTADITFPFPVSNTTVQNATGIESELGNSKWFVNVSNVIKANNTDNYLPNYALTWNIIPSFDNGTFSFKIKNVLTGKYIPTFTSSQGYNTANTVVEEENAGSFYFMPCIETGMGFSINKAGTIFLSINSSGSDQNIWTWTKGGTHKGSNLTFPTISVTNEDIKTAYNTKVATYTAVEKLDILEGSTVVACSEFPHTPAEINAAIDQLIAYSEENNYSEMDEIIRGKSTTQATIISDYLSMLNTYKNNYNLSLFTCKFDVTHPYNTLILPRAAKLPEGIKLYNCSGTEDNGTTLVLTEESGTDIKGSKPYIVESSVGNKYTFITWDEGDRTSKTNGWLTGVLADAGETVPENSYVLAYKKSAGVQAFYLTDGTVTCPQTKCYLTAPATANTASVKAFFLSHNGETTGIEDVFNGKNGETVIYNTAGQRINKLQKGINIVNGHKVLVK